MSVKWRSRKTVSSKGRKQRSPKGERGTSASFEITRKKVASSRRKPLWKTAHYQGGWEKNTTSPKEGEEVRFVQGENSSSRQRRKGDSSVAPKKEEKEQHHAERAVARTGNPQK